jgi:hypothetical protein
MLATGLLLLSTALSTLVAHAGVRYVVPLILTACALFGALVALSARHLPRGGGFAVAGVASLLCVGPNVAMYTHIQDLMAPEQLSKVNETQAAIEAIDQRRLSTGYADYWTAYPITYVSGERIVVAPALPVAFSDRLDRYPPYTEYVDAVVSPTQVFVLVDRRCSTEPYLHVLAASGATYQADPVARWLLIWDIQVVPGAESATLVDLRTAIAAQRTC